MSSSSPSLTPFQLEVTSRFGLVPNFFMSAPDAPEIVERLWAFAVSAYFDSPIPSLFKERLFVYLSRFCEVRYCVIRHCAFLLGYGHSAGDPSAPPRTVQQAIRLLMRATPWERGAERVAAALEESLPCADWPAPESDLEDRLFSAATLVFVEGRRSDRARAALRHVLGGRRYEHLLGFLAFIRMAHYWTVLHPDLPLEDDAKELLKVNEQLAECLLHDPEAARCDLGERLFAELDELRSLNERRELEFAKHELEAEVRQKELLLREVNHRIKNSLQIVSGILHLQGAHTNNTEARAALENASARVLAIAAVHEGLYSGKEVGVALLDVFLTNLCSHIEDALAPAGGINLDLASVEVPADIAVPMALVANELLTNALKYGRPPYHVALKVEGGCLVLTVGDGGVGPATDDARTGLGSQLIAAGTKQLTATLETKRDSSGYRVEMIVPLRASAKHESVNS